MGLSRIIAGSKDDPDRCEASRVQSPPLASVEVTTNSVIICIPAHAVAGTFQPTPAAIVSSPAASLRSAFWKRRDLETGRVHETHSIARSLTEPGPAASYRTAPRPRARRRERLSGTPPVPAPRR